MVYDTEKAIAERIVAAVTELADAIRAQRAHAEKTGRDASPIVGHLVGAIRARGGHMPSNPHELRWPLEERPRPMTDPTGLRAAIGLAGVVAEALLARHGDDDLADDLARVWPEHGTRAAAQAALDEARRRDPAPAAAPPARKATVAPRIDATKSMAMPLVDRPSPPPGNWIDGEYVIEEFVRHPTVG